MLQPFAIALGARAVIAARYADWEIVGPPESRADVYIGFIPRKWLSTYDCQRPILLKNSKLR
jgi:hypothetical protein